MLVSLALTPIFFYIGCSFKKAITPNRLNNSQASFAFNSTLSTTIILTNRYRHVMSSLKALHANDTWDLVELPKDRMAIPNKWVYKTKIVDGKPKYKARTIAKGYAQKQGIDFRAVFSPIVKMTSFSYNNIGVGIIPNGC